MRELEDRARGAVREATALIALFQLDGRMFSSGGITKKMAANAEIPPAVLRTIAPSASAKTPTSIR